MVRAVHLFMCILDASCTGHDCALVVVLCMCVLCGCVGVVHLARRRFGAFGRAMGGWGGFVFYGAAIIGPLLGGWVAAGGDLEKKNRSTTRKFGTKNIASSNPRIVITESKGQKKEREETREKKEKRDTRHGC